MNTLTHVANRKSTYSAKHHNFVNAVGSRGKQHPRISQILNRESIQPKLTIGAPNDKYEQEADRVADQVMRMPDPAVQRQTDVEEGQQNSLIQTKPLAQQITPLNTATTQRLCTACEDPLQRKPSNDTIQRDQNFNELDDDLIQAKSTTTPEVTPNISAGIQSLQGGGRPLSKPERNFFEPRFGTDFSNVRLHTDTHAANIAHSINARAFTHGNNIAFSAGEYSSDSLVGKSLLSHELAHVVQQGGDTRQRIQRRHVLENHPMTAPPMTCNIAPWSPINGPSLVITFTVSSDTLSAADKASVSAFIRSWHLSAPETVRVDGYASIDGPPSDNWTLSCSRARSIENELRRPADGTRGIPANNIEVFAHGETDHVSSSLTHNRIAQLSLPLVPHLPRLNLPDMRFSSMREYGYSRREATELYGLSSATNLVPARAFNQQSSGYGDYTKKWSNSLSTDILNLLGGDCAKYARKLIWQTGRAPLDDDTSTRRGIGLVRTYDLRPGEAYYIRPRRSGRGVEEDVLSPWNNRITVRKQSTNFHVAMVVAKDDRTVITSEVNAAFPGRVRPWFSMYRGNHGFYRTYQREYTRERVRPGLWRM